MPEKTERRWESSTCKSSNMVNYQTGKYGCPAVLRILPLKHHHSSGCPRGPPKRHQPGRQGQTTAVGNYLEDFSLLQQPQMPPLSCVQCLPSTTPTADGGLLRPPPADKTAGTLTTTITAKTTTTVATTTAATPTTRPPFVVFQLHHPPPPRQQRNLPPGPSNTRGSTAMATYTPSDDDYTPGDNGREDGNHEHNIAPLFVSFAATTISNTPLPR